MLVLEALPPVCTQMRRQRHSATLARVVPLILFLYIAFQAFLVVYIKSTTIDQLQPQPSGPSLSSQSKMSPILKRQAAMFVTHGGGPMPVLGERKHASLTAFLKNASNLLPQQPSAIVSVTAHWLQDETTVSTNPQPSMLYDYGGFPEESYQLQFPAPGSPDLATKIVGLLKDAGISCRTDNKRGYDHGTFVPLMLMFPKADIPVVQMSLSHHLDPQQHIKVGQALESLRDENVLIVGSGSSFHNMRVFMQTLATGASASKAIYDEAQAFDDYLYKACCQASPAERLQLLTKWSAAPGAKLAHPPGGEEHLLPLHVVVGAAGNDPGSAPWKNDSLGIAASSYVFNAA